MNECKNKVHENKWIMWKKREKIKSTCITCENM